MDSVCIGGIGVSYCNLAGGVGLNTNSYSDVLSLTISSIASLYVICYFSKRIERNVIGKCLAYCGKESFYIMALHFVGFKVMTILLNLCGFQFSLSALTAPSKGNFVLTLAYVCMGVCFPLVFMYLFRKIKNILF